VDQRRGDALIGVCRRATAATAMVTRAGAKATVIVTIGLDDLRDRCRPGVLVGGVGGLDGGTCWGRRRSAGWPATPASSPPCWPGPGRSWTWADTGGVHLRPSTGTVATRPALHLPRLHHPRHWADAHTGLVIRQTRLAAVLTTAGWPSRAYGRYRPDALS